MAVKISGIIIIISVICSFFTGNVSALTTAAISGCGKAVTTAFSLLGMMCLWCGIMKVAEKCGALDLFAKILSPILRFVFPKAYKSGVGIKEISAALAANILGVGNAATPLALSAMNALEKEKDGSASDDMITFTLLGCAPPCLFPTTVISLRAASGSISPTEIVPAVCICSISLAVLSVVLSRLLSGGRK